MYHLTMLWFTVVIVSNIVTWILARRYERLTRAKRLRGDVS